MLNFTFAELCKSETAEKYKVNNIPPSIEVQDNLLALITKVLQPLRNKLKCPIKVTSGYRCSFVNQMVGGVLTSQHMTGEAADIKVAKMSVTKLFETIKNSDIEYDQLINEHNQWVHVSYSRKKNRKQAFKL